MTNKIKITFVLFAFLLNFAHDVQPHNHSVESQICDLNIFEIFHHDNHEHSKNLHHQDNESGSGNSDDCDEGELPFSHHHINHIHDFTQIRNILNTSHIFKITFFIGSQCITRPIVNFHDDIITVGIFKLYQSIIGTNNCLRAPPVI